MKFLVEARKRLKSLPTLSLHELLQCHVYTRLRGSRRVHLNCPVKLGVGYKNIVGVWGYTYKLLDTPSPQPHLLLELAELQLARSSIVELLAEIAEYEKALVNLGAEITRLKRIVSMLEKICIPRLERTIRYLSMKFDEMKHEETIRAIKIKKRIARE